MTRFYKMLLPYFVGVATAPLVGVIAKPLMRSAIKATIGIGLEVKKLAVGAAEDLQDLVAEASAEFAATETKYDVSATARQERSDGRVGH